MWTCQRTQEMQRTAEDRNMLKSTKRRKRKSMGHWTRRNCVLNGKKKRGKGTVLRQIEVTKRQMQNLHLRSVVTWGPPWSHNITACQGRAVPLVRSKIWYYVTKTTEESMKKIFGFAYARKQKYKNKTKDHVLGHWVGFSISQRICIDWGLERVTEWKQREESIFQ